MARGKTPGRPSRPRRRRPTRPEAARVEALLARAAPGAPEEEARRALAELALIAPDDPRVVELLRERSRPLPRSADACRATSPTARAAVGPARCPSTVSGPRRSGRAFSRGDADR